MKMNEKVKRLIFKKKILLCLLARRYVQRDLNNYPIKKYLVPFIPYSSIEEPQEKRKLRKAQKDFYKQTRDSLVIKLAREAIDKYLQNERAEEYFKNRGIKYEWYWAKDSLENIVKDVVGREIKAFRRERREEVKIWLTTRVVRKNKKVENEEFNDNLNNKKANELLKAREEEEFENRVSLEELFEKANLTEEEIEMLYNGAEESSPKYKEIVEKIREKNQISLNSPIAPEKSLKKQSVSPLRGKISKECCDLLNSFATDWLINMLLGKDSSKPDLLKQVEDFYNVDFQFPNYHFEYLNQIAKNIDIKPEKLQRFLEKIEFPYIYPLSKIRREGKRVCLIDVYRLNEYSGLTRYYFKAENRVRIWRKALNNGFTRFRATQFMKRKIDKGIVPSYYFDVIPSRKEYISYLVTRKKQPIDLPMGVWKEGDDRPLTHKEVEELLKGHFRKLRKLRSKLLNNLK